MTVKECYEIMGGDYDDVLNRLRTDDRIVRFLSRVAADTTFELLQNSLKDGKVDEAFRAAHTLKGVCMNLSLTRLQKSSSNLTEALRGKTEISGAVAPLFETVKTDYELTVKSINELLKSLG